MLDGVTLPRILITTAARFRNDGLRRTDSVTGQNYSEAVAQAGGLPLMVSTLGPSLAEAYIDQADGLLLTGGGDIEPSFYGAEPHPDIGMIDLPRDLFEFALYRAAKTKGIPVLGVCRGLQLINVAEGGSLHQHLPAVAGTIQHDQRDIGGEPTHRVAVVADSRYGQALARYQQDNAPLYTFPRCTSPADSNTPHLRCNSFHHQAVLELGTNLRATGTTADGVIEALEGTTATFVLAVQWHPEMSFRRYPEHRLPFVVFVEAVRARLEESDETLGEAPNAVLDKSPCSA